MELVLASSQVRFHGPNGIVLQYVKLFKQNGINFDFILIQRRHVLCSGSVCFLANTPAGVLADLLLGRHLWRAGVLADLLRNSHPIRAYGWSGRFEKRRMFDERLAITAG